MPINPDAGWTAPDSWAVKPVAGAKPQTEDDDSDEEFDRSKLDKASLPPTPLLNGEAESETNGRTAHSRRPGTGNSLFPSLGISKHNTTLVSIHTVFQ
jgi:hypothetical protein